MTLYEYVTAEPLRQQHKHDLGEHFAEDQINALSNWELIELISNCSRRKIRSNCMWLLIVISCSLLVHECVHSKRVFSTELLCTQAYTDVVPNTTRFIKLPCREAEE